MSSAQRASQLAQCLEDKEINFDVTPEGAVVSMFGGHNFDNVKVAVEFGGEGESEFATILMFGIAKAPGSLSELAEPLMMEFNRDYRWGRWTMDDHDVMMDQNIYLPVGADGSELIFAHLMSMLAVVDDAYPKLMRTIYG